MKSRVALLCLGLVGAGFGMDEYLPVQKGKLEVDLAYGLTKVTGGFNDDGERESWEDVGFPSSFSPTLHAFGAQFKYGLAAGLDVELALVGTTSNDDGELFAPAGLARPEIGVKYAIPAMGGAGVYANLGLPIGTGDYEDALLNTSLELGGVYQNRFGDFRLTGRAGYTVNFEADDVKQGNTLLLLAKPEAMWTEYVGTYLGVLLVAASQDEVSGFELDNGGYVLTLAPGLNAQLLPNLAYEISVPFAVAGENSLASWGLTAQVYYTLP